MIVVTVNFPDERTGIDHLHSQFEESTDAATWLLGMRLKYGRNLQGHVDETEDTWVCPECRWSTRGGRRPSLRSL